MKQPTTKRGFSGKLGYVLATAGSAVGLGNIWRFPYLAAKYGGGAFLLVYIILALTFGYAMIMSETALGRMTGKSPVGAFSRFSRRGLVRAGGWINAVIPILIVPYYSVIGGWVLHYLLGYLRGQSDAMADDAFFTAFLASPLMMELCFLAFALMTMLVIFSGVQHGIERVSKIMMPILVVLSLIVAGYSVTRPGALAGVRYFLIPDFRSFSLMTFVSALGQMFYSLSIAMGILITFGSYTGRDVTLPKVFSSMGGAWIGILFFLLVLLAALTSSVSLAESACATFEDELGWSRPRSAALMSVILVGLGSLSCLGFNLLSGVTPMGMDILSFFDFLTNSVMMPVAAAAICLLILFVIGLDRMETEISSSSPFRRRRVYRIVIRYFALVLLAVILISSLADAFGLIHI